MVLFSLCWSVQPEQKVSFCSPLAVDFRPGTKDFIDPGSNHSRNKCVGSKVCSVVVSEPTRFPNLYMTAVFTSLWSTTELIFLEIQCLMNFFHNNSNFDYNWVRDFNLLLFNFKILDVLQNFPNSGVDFLWRHQIFVFHSTYISILAKCPCVATVLILTMLLFES